MHAERVGFRNIFWIFRETLNCNKIFTHDTGVFVVQSANHPQIRTLSMLCLLSLFRIRAAFCFTNFITPPGTVGSRRSQAVSYRGTENKMFVFKKTKFLYDWPNKPFTNRRDFPGFFAQHQFHRVFSTDEAQALFWRRTHVTTMKVINRALIDFLPFFAPPFRCPERTFRGFGDAFSKRRFCGLSCLRCNNCSSQIRFSFVVVFRLRFWVC